MIKVLHTADIHLDVPFKIANVAKAQTRRSELRGALIERRHTPGVRVVAVPTRGSSTLI